MAGICFVCKAALQSAELAVRLYHAQTANSSSNTDGFKSDPRLFCHRNCFVCSACNSPLQVRFDAYSISPDDRLYCSKHSSYTEDELLLRALSEFKARSLALKAALEHECDEHSEDNEKTKEAVHCTCNKALLVEHVPGYWIECVHHNCVKNTASSSNDQATRFYSARDFGPSRLIGHVASTAPEEFYRQYFYGMKHWNYCGKEEDVGAIIITLKSGSTSPSKGDFRILVRSAYYLVVGLLSANQHNCLSSHEEVVQFLMQQIGILSPLKLITAASAPADLLKMEMAFIKQAYKFGIVYMREGQQTEEDLFGNETHSEAFDEFLSLLGERVRLRGFRKYRAGLDGNNDLTGKYSVYTKFANNEIMFHVSTLLPFEETDPQKLQRKRHIGNDIVCIVFMEATKTAFIPDCIKSNFLHSFIIVQVDVETSPNLYTVSVVSRDHVPLYGPYLSEKHVFEKNAEFREWILRKLIQGEQACHRAPNFARLHARTRGQIMAQLLKNVDKNSPTVDERKMYQYPTSLFGYAENDLTMGQQVVRDFSSTTTSHIHDREDKVAFLVGSTDQRRFVGVKSVMAAKSKVFYKMLFQDLTPGVAQQQNSKPDTAHPVLKRTISWTRTSSSAVQTGLRSRKFNLQKTRRSKSESDNSFDGVMLASVTDLETKNRDRLSGPTGLVYCQELAIQEFDGDVFEALLEFLHTGSCDLGPSLLPGLLCAAEQYQVYDLRNACVETLEQSITAETACDMLSYLDKQSNSPWTDAAKKKIVDIASQVSPSILQCNGFAHLSEENVELILSRSYKANQTVLFQAILGWAKSYNERTGCQKSVEELAQPLIHKFVNVQQIPTHEIQEVVQPNGVVSNEAVDHALTVHMQRRNSITDTRC